MWMAGGGVKGGFKYGSTDDYGYYAVDKKMHIHDVHATILHLLGLDHERLTYQYAGRDFRLTDVAGEVARELLRLSGEAVAECLGSCRARLEHLVNASG